MAETTFVMVAICGNCETELRLQDIHTGCPNCDNRVNFIVTYKSREAVVTEGELDEQTDERGE